MSTVILTQDWEREKPGGEKTSHKKGEKISVPFFIGKDLIANGIGVYPQQPVKPKSAAESEVEQLRREKEELRAQLDAQQKQIEDLTAPGDLSLTSDPPNKGKK